MEDRGRQEDRLARSAKFIHNYRGSTGRAVVSFEYVGTIEGPVASVAASTNR